MGDFKVDIIKGDGKKVNDGVEKAFIRIPQQLTKVRNHWAMFFKLQDQTWMKVDLLSLGYRIIYNSNHKPSSGFIGVDRYYAPTIENAAKHGNTNSFTRGRVLSALLIAKMKHDQWIGSGDERFDCQDFCDKMVEALELEVVREKVRNW